MNPSFATMVETHWGRKTRGTKLGGGSILNDVRNLEGNPEPRWRRLRGRCSDSDRLSSLRYWKAVLILAISLAAAFAWQPIFLAAEAEPDVRRLDRSFQQEVQPLLKRFCAKCHSSDVAEADVDLTEFRTFADIRQQTKIWLRVREMLDSEQMPPKEAPQPDENERARLRMWVRGFLQNEARAQAGDPGPVILRRLTNDEYNYTVRDLTSVDSLDPTREFPVDGAAGEGFTNAGTAQAMSPALVQKYLDAAKQVASHAVLTSDGIRFSPGNSQRDWTDELLYEIRSIYAKYTAGRAATDDVHRWSPSELLRVMKLDGRVRLEPYLRALIRHRERLLKDESAADAVASDEGLNARYLRHLANLLAADRPTFLLRQLRDQWRTAKPADAGRLESDIRRWQERLWKFQPVGHIGRVGGPKAWMNPVTPIVPRQPVRLKLPTQSSGDIVLYLAAVSTNGPADKAVVWEQPQLVFTNHPPILLRDVNSLMPRLSSVMARELRRTSEYLSAVAEAHASDKPLESVSENRQLNPVLLSHWAELVRLGNSAVPAVEGHYKNKLSNVGGYADLRGWGSSKTPVLLTNRSKAPIKHLTLTVPARGVTVHPSPTQDAIVVWRSPIDGKVRLKGLVADADDKCGNGGAWRVEFVTRLGTEVVASGVFDNGGRKNFQPETEYAVQPGDQVRLVVNAREREHVCDTTHVELTVTEVGNKARVWDLAGDVIDRIHLSNPLADSYGNAGTWHFCAAAAGQASNPSDRGAMQSFAGSALAVWRQSVIDGKAKTDVQQVAQVVQRILAEDEPPNDSANIALRGHLLNPLGPLGWLAVAARGNKTSQDNGNIEMAAPAVLEFHLPAAIAAGAQFVTTGRLPSKTGTKGSVQMQASLNKPDLNVLLPELPIVAVEGSDARKRVEAAMADFRELLPPAMCHAQIVPVDEVVTLTLFHREDEPLRRLMLSEQEAARLDRLWDELIFVSEEPLKKVVVHEQIYEFATQDRPDLVKAFAPLKKPIAERAEAFRRRQLSSEPKHWQAVLEFANRAWRRPLSDKEQTELRDLYKNLRAGEIPHDKAIRLTVARVLTSPAFLYRLESPAPGSRPARVSDLELASRLSYFLWSSLSDAELRSAAESGRLGHDQQIVAQMHRMLDDRRTRRLAVHFACHWLHFRDFDKNDDKNEKLYPQFATLRKDMYEETVRFFEDMFRNNGSILDMLDADHTFLNEAMAKHYGMDWQQNRVSSQSKRDGRDTKGATGNRLEGWQRVDGVRAKGRGGVLAMATFLASQSGASRTSPILRGNWIYETLLGERLPRPPANVPQLPEQVPQGLTARELIERHSKVAACAKCHARIDPFGFALEQYDAIGRLRPQKADTITVLPGGQAVDGMDGLRRYLATQRRDDVARQFCRKLLGYALGREIQLSDEPLLDTMASELADDGYRFRTAVKTVVLSDQFRKIRGSATSND